MPRDVERGRFVEQVGFEVCRVVRRTVAARTFGQEAVADDVLHHPGAGDALREFCALCVHERPDLAAQPLDGFGG